MLIQGCILAAVPETHLRLGSRYRSLPQKLAEAEALVVQVPTVLSNEMRQWASRGTETILDQYVKALWIAIRAQRPKLEAMGLPLATSTRMFDQQYFTASVDKIRRCMFSSRS